MSKRLPPQFEVNIEKLSRIGEGVGRYKKRKVFVFGALPGEKVLVRPLKKRRGGVKAGVIEVLERSKERREAKEDHYLACSPWQIIGEETQLKWKKQIVKEMFINETGKLPAKDVQIVASPVDWNYRNKMEFSFTKDKDNDISLAFHQRFRYWDYYPLEKCVLAKEKINILAEKIVKSLKEKKIKNESLKNLLIRYSTEEDKCLAVLYVVDEDFETFDFSDSDLVGWKIIYSDPQSPTTIATKLLFESGKEYLQEKVFGLSFRYYYDGFFQVNVEAFDLLLDYVSKNIESGKVLSDLYSGVGTVGFSLAKLFEKVNSIEFDARAVSLAKENARNNNIKNIEFAAGAAEKENLDECLKNTDTLVVDPPRSGLHPKVIKKILQNKPKNFVYISCNPHTQAQNFREIKKEYKVLKWRLFDMYSQTPHVESVIIMKRKNFLEKLLKL